MKTGRCASAESFVGQSVAACLMVSKILLDVRLTFALGYFLHPKTVDPRPVRLTDNDGHTRPGVLEPETIITAHLHLLSNREVALPLINLSVIQDWTITGS